MSGRLYLRHGQQTVARPEQAPDKVGRAYVVGIIVGLALGALAALLYLSAVARMLPPCESDDGGPVACYWDASEQGNGTGHDFVYTPGRD